MTDRSKHAVTFLNRITQFDADLELVDVIVSAIDNEELVDDNNGLLFKYVNKDKHPVLSKRKNIEDNRKLAINHLKQTVYASYVKDVYEEFTAFLQGLIYEAFTNSKVNPERIVGEHKVSMSTVDILKYTENNTLIEKVIESIFQSLENERSTLILINKTCKKLDLNINDNIKEQAIYYLEMRHILVHTDGKADNEFIRKHPNLRYTKKNYIVLNYATISTMRSNIKKLVSALDQSALEKGIVRPHIGN
ncbi:MAG: hypothetical protein U9N81_04195 [Bacillota bacterium]|nr:hypothetical protein [Bacillota bacterium]